MAISAKSAQDFVPIKEISNSTVIMHDGTMRGVILCSSVNFALKSEDERSAILGQFRDFLNSLDFSVQISVQSRKLDIKPYLELLKSREESQTNDLMKVQLREYSSFIKELTSKINVMTKLFFVVVPYSPAAVSIGSKGGLFSFGRSKQSFSEKNANFEENLSQLDERLSFVMQGLNRTGIRTERLNTEALIEMYYKSFNPGDGGKLTQVGK